MKKTTPTNPNGSIGQMMSDILGLLEKYDKRICDDMEQDYCKCILTKGILDDESLQIELVPQVGIAADIMKDLIEDLEATFGLEGTFLQGKFFFTYWV